MKTPRPTTLCLMAALALSATSVLNHARAFQPAPPDAEEGVEVLTRGPVHEAFAETVTFDPQPGIVVPNAPPDAIEELPPDQRPEGDNVDWIPGYWAWDDDRDDFLWVSGIWRALPPGRQWVSGYWAPAGREFQWTSGYWADAEQEEVEYLSEPPVTVEAGPNIEAPSVNHLWTPGNWMWNQNRYAWRPGYWAPAQQNWLWVPAHYVWTPRGYVFLDGYHDYTVARRGVLFAPVYFNSGIRARRGYSYSPAVVISTALFGNQLFLRPNYSHYYFGDYYSNRYAGAGFHPCHSYNSGGRGYDPFYAQARWQNRQNSSWARTVETDYQYRRDHESARPPRTWAAQQALVRSGDTTIQNNLVVATSLNQLAKNNDTPLRFQSVNKDERQKLASHGRDVQQFRVERQKLEAKGGGASPDSPAKVPQPEKSKLPKSPILAKSAAQLDSDHAPPKRHEVLKPDLKVEPKPRKPGVQTEAPKVKPIVPKTETEPSPKVEPKPRVEPKPTPKVEPKPKVEPRPTPKVEPKPRVEPKPTPKVEPKPKFEPKPASKAEPKPKVEPKPKFEPKPKPKVEPKPTPKVEPKPKLEPKPTPKVEPKPRVEPKPSPKVGPKPKLEPKPKGPKSEPKDKPKTKDQDKPKGI